MNKVIFFIRLFYGVVLTNFRIYHKYQRFPNRYDLQMYISLMKTGMLMYNVTHGIQNNKGVSK